MKKAVSVIFSHQGEIFVIQRKNDLKVFPGYTAFIGGKVDKDDEKEAFNGQYLKDFPADNMHALVRETKEECGIDIVELIQKKLILDFFYLGDAITPAFNPHRFDTHFYVLEFKEKIPMTLDTHEFEKGYWITPEQLLIEFNDCKIMAVPPTIQIIEAMRKKDKSQHQFGISYDPETMVPMIEVVKGVKQFIPLSNTFPPANRTNCFLIGEEDGHGILVDPSPKNKEELSKLYNSILPYKIRRIFLTHHHPDHHEFSTHLARTLDVPMKMSADTFKRIKKKWGDDYFDGIEIKLAKEGNVITSSYSKEVIAFHVPGHDEGQLALATKDMEWMIVGDLIQTIGTVVIAGPSGNMQKYFESLQKVIDLNPTFIFPSHGIGIGSTYKIQKTLEHRKVRENQIIDCLKRGLNEDQILIELYSEIAPELHPYALMTIESHIIKIKTEKLI